MKERVDQEMNRTASVSAAELPTLQFSVGIGCIHCFANQLGLPYGLSSESLFDSFDWRVGTMVENATVTHQSDQTATQKRLRESNMDSPVLDNNKSFRSH